jgi:hypothetical protein
LEGIGAIGKVVGTGVSGGGEAVIEVTPEIVGRSISKKEAKTWLQATRKLEARLGRPVQPADFVAYAKTPEGKSIHGFFTWDNRVAGDKYRRLEAGFYCRAVRIRFAEGASPIRAVVNVKLDDQRGYVDADTALKTPEYRKQLLADARRELRQLEIKWKALARWIDSPEFGRAIEHVTRAIGELEE